MFLATRREARDGPLLVVKRILPHLQDRADFVQMFLDEARLTSSLFHDNLVRVHDFGKAEGVHYIAMEYVDGLSLSLVLRRQPGRKLPLVLACWLVAETCAGLDYAHQRKGFDGRSLGIVHRDVSPDNILISQGGEVKLADFGIAKAKIQLTRTRPGQLKGKFSYMSPEQGMRLKVDCRSDIFAAGLVLYEITTGSRVFPAGNEVETLRALYERRYTPPEQKVPDYPPQLAAVVNRALDWDPEQRFQQASDLREALLELLPSGADPKGDLAVLVQCLREQLQLHRQLPSEQSTKQQSPVQVIVPASSQRDTLLGVGERARPSYPLMLQKVPTGEETVQATPRPRVAAAPRTDPSISSVLFPLEQPPQDPEELEEGETLQLGVRPRVSDDTEPMQALEFDDSRGLTPRDAAASRSAPTGARGRAAASSRSAPTGARGPARARRPEGARGTRIPEPAQVELDDRDTVKVPSLPDEWDVDED